MVLLLEDAERIAAGILGQHGLSATGERCPTGLADVVELVVSGDLVVVVPQSSLCGAHRHPSLSQVQQQ